MALDELEEHTLILKQNVKPVDGVRHFDLDLLGQKVALGLKTLGRFDETLLQKEQNVVLEFIPQGKSDLSEFDAADTGAPGPAPCVRPPPPPGSAEPLAAC